MVRVRNRFMVVWGVDSNLGVSPPCDADGDIFINGGTDDLSAILSIKIGDVGAASH